LIWGLRVVSGVEVKRSLTELKSVGSGVMAQGKKLERVNETDFLQKE
jgi:hypothetical protein